MAIEFRSIHDIAVPPAEVMAALTAFEEWPAWMNGLETIERLTDGPYGVGTRWRETRKLMGRSATEEFEVVGFEPPNRVELLVDGSRGSTGKGEYRFVYSLEPSDRGTRLVLNAEIDMPGTMAKLAGGMLKGMLKKAIDADIDSMKRYLEDRSNH